MLFSLSFLCSLALSFTVPAHAQDEDGRAAIGLELKDRKAPVYGAI